MRILSQSYDMTVHAIEEMAEDDLDILDIEEVILNDRSFTEKRMILEEPNSQSKALP